MSKYKDSLPKRIFKLFFSFALPNIFLYIFLFFCVINGDYEMFFDPQSAFNPVLLGLGFCILLPVWMGLSNVAKDKSKFCTILAIVVMAISATILILEMLDMVVNKLIYNVLPMDSLSKESIYNLLLFNSTALALNGACLWDFGTFEEDSSYVSGSHMELTFDNDGKGTIREVEDFSGGGEILNNAFLFFFRFMVVMIGGIIIFIVKVKKLSTGFNLWEIKDGILFQYSGVNTSIEIPPQVRKINANAFKNPDIQEIIMTDSVTEIEAGAFSNLGKLKNVKLSNNLTYISDALFAGCNELSHIDLPESITYIGRNAFEKTHLESINIPKNVSVIEPFAFCLCAYLRSVVFKNGLKEIKENAFCGCKNLSIVIPQTVDTIEKGAFNGCDGSRAYIVQDFIPGKWHSLNGIYTICGVEAFHTDENGIIYCLCKGSKAIIIGYTGVSNYIIIPDTIFNNNVVSMIEDSFENCTVESITIPKSLKSIGNQKNFNLKKVKYNGTREEWRCTDTGWDPWRKEENIKIICSDGYYN